MLQCRFAGAVTTPRWIGVHGGIGRDVDDQSIVLFLHSWQDELRQLEWCDDIYFQNPLELLGCQLLHLGEWTWSKLGGVVDQDVDAAELVVGLRAVSCRMISVCDV